MAAAAAVVLILLLVGAAEALADGAYIPEQAVRKPPAIPAQTALISYSDGQEQLIVESALDGEGQSFGWIVPVPAAPTELAEASPGLLRTLELACGPAITHGLGRIMSGAVVGAAVVTMLALWVYWFGKKLTQVALVLLLVCLVGAVFLSSLGESTALGARPVAGVRLEQSATVGSYDVAVLEAQSAEDLGRWLETNGYAALSEKGRAIVADYVRDRWHFVAARLRREGDGLSVPHPLSITFPASQPVYPMRLTAIAGSEVHVDLFVVGKGRARCAALQLELCDSYRFSRVPAADYVQTSVASLGDVVMVDEPGVLPGYVGQEYDLLVGHPRAGELMWDGCTLTRLSGTLRPEEMASDIAITIDATEALRARYYSRQGALSIGVIGGPTFWTVIWIGGLIYLAVRRPGRRQALCLPCVAGAVAIGVSLILYLALPKVDVQPLGRWGPEPQARTAISSAAGAGALDGPTAAEIRQALKSHLARSRFENELTGGIMKVEDSPGNLDIIEDERGIVVRTFDMRGFPRDAPVADLLEALERRGYF